MRRARSQRPRRTGSSSGNEAKDGISFGRLQAVADAMDGMNDFRRSIHCDLLAQSVDVYLDEVGLTVKIRIPDMLDDLAAADDFRCFGEQEFKKGKFLCSQSNRLARPEYGTAMTIQLNVRESENPIALAHPSPDQGSHSSEQFGNR